MENNIAWLPLLDEEGKEIGDCEKWINVGYKYSGPYAKALSNLFPYEFEFIREAVVPNTVVA